MQSLHKLMGVDGAVGAGALAGEHLSLGDVRGYLLCQSLLVTFLFILYDISILCSQSYGQL